ncbi:hypothetical protein QBC38DRAFT_489967 [Podospora fimiseda]|uniref:Mitochondrial transcription factor 1 n=1 Tax=Podospora fimiseda TaxID=252190 RepID=A0AAN6YP84_9PEZI|nr:hypothetical protein QBC38DRAFT_489967 [Podospora fimiseda]
MMFPARIRLRASLHIPQNGCSILLQRRFASTALGKPSGSTSLCASNILKTSTPLAKKLKDTFVWRAPGQNRSKPPIKGDKYRVNVVSEELCDDIINYIKPTLERHKGCDIIDLFPGAGLWSKKMHDFLEPRSHLLLEPDIALYQPFLQDLLDRPGVKHLPESGIIWEELIKVLNPENLPHQVEKRYPPNETPERNDSLLVLANLSMFPKRKFRSFDSLAQLVLYQFISSIRPGALIQKYGLVRMLVWTSDVEKFGTLPRTVQRRRRQAFEAEINTQCITEVAGADTANVDNNTGTARGFFRDSTLDMESVAKTYKRMQKGGFSLIPGRETQLMRDYLDVVESGEDPVTSANDEAFIMRPFRQELAELQEKVDTGQITGDDPEWKRYKRLVYKANWADKRQASSTGLLSEMQAVEEIFVAAHSGKRARPKMLEKAEDADADWNYKVEKLERTLRNELILLRDNWHIFNQNPPVLQWDRRYVDPLVVKDDEFFPSVPCALLDIEPRAIERIFREMGAGTTRAGDTFDIILRALMSYTMAPIGKALDSIYPGAAEAILPLCPSLRDPAQGGRYGTGYSEVTARTLNLKQMEEIAVAWDKWPFKPDWAELIARTTTEDVAESYEGESMSTSRWDL